MDSGKYTGGSDCFFQALSVCAFPIGCVCGSVDRDCVGMDWEFGGSEGETGIRKNENMLLLRDKRHVFVYIEHLV